MDETHSICDGYVQLAGSCSQSIRMVSRLVIQLKGHDVRHSFPEFSRIVLNVSSGTLISSAM
jgi:hypothetical protein